MAETIRRVAMGKKEYRAGLPNQEFNEGRSFLASVVAQVVSTQVKGYRIAIARIAHDRRGRIATVLADFIWLTHG